MIGGFSYKNTQTVTNNEGFYFQNGNKQAVDFGDHINNNIRRIYNDVHKEESEVSMISFMVTEETGIDEYKRKIKSHKIESAEELFDKLMGKMICDSFN